MLGSMRLRLLMLERITPELHCFNFNVWKEKTRITKFGRIRSELQCLEGEDQNSTVWKEKVRISAVWKH